VEADVTLDMNVRVEKLRIGPVQPVLDPEPAVAGVELEVVEVVELRGEGEGEVVAGVVIHHLEQGDIYRRYQSKSV